MFWQGAESWSSSPHSREPLSRRAHSRWLSIKCAGERSIYFRDAVRQLAKVEQGDHRLRISSKRGPKASFFTATTFCHEPCTSAFNEHRIHVPIARCNRGDPARRRQKLRLHASYPRVLRVSAELLGALLANSAMPRLEWQSDDYTPFKGGPIS